MHRDLGSAPSARAAASWSWRRPDGASERNLEALDEEKRALSDVIADAPLPIQDYVSTLTVRATDDGHCEVTWACSFAPDGGAPRR